MFSTFIDGFKDYLSFIGKLIYQFVEKLIISHSCSDKFIDKKNMLK
jgi:hypothetical protein